MISESDRDCTQTDRDRMMSTMPSCSISRSVEEPFGALVTAFSARLRELQSVALLRIDGAQHTARPRPSPARPSLDGLPGSAQSQRRSSLHRTWQPLRYVLSFRAGACQQSLKTTDTRVNAHRQTYAAWSTSCRRSAPLSSASGKQSQR